MRFALLLTLGALGCSSGARLELPQQVIVAGLGADKRMEPCTSWCAVGGPVSALTTSSGMPVAYRVRLPPAKWDAVLKDSKGKWGTPDAVYKLTPGGFKPKPKPKVVPTGIGKPKPEAPAPPPEPSLTWSEKADKLHNSMTPKAMKVLDRGDEYQTTNFAMWSSGNSLVRVDSDDKGLQAWWIALDRLDKI